MSFIKVLENKFEGDVLRQFKDAHDELNLYNRPETYCTLLKGDYGNNSPTLKLKRKFKRLRKDRLIYDETIPSINGRVKLFFVFDKNYYIVLTSSKEIYYCSEFTKMGELFLLRGAFRLDKCEWVDCGEIYLENGVILKCF